MFFLPTYSYSDDDDELDADDEEDEEEGTHENGHDPRDSMQKPVKADPDGDPEPHYKAREALETYSDETLAKYKERELNADVELLDGTHHYFSRVPV